MSEAPLAITAHRTPQELVAQSVGTSLKDKDADAAKQFEGLLMANLFQCLRKTVSHSNLFGSSGSAQSTYEYMLDQAVVEHAMAAGKGFGLSDRLQAGWQTKGINKLSSVQDLISKEPLPIPTP